MSIHNFKSRYVPILKVIFAFIINAIVLAYIDFYRTSYKGSMQETLDSLNGSLIFGIRFSFFIFILLGLFKVFQQKKNS